MKICVGPDVAPFRLPCLGIRDYLEPQARRQRHGHLWWLGVAVHKAHADPALPHGNGRPCYQHVLDLVREENTALAECADHYFA